MTTQSIADIRREYVSGKLDREDLNDDPMEQFQLWLKDAVDAKLPDPTAMTVATVDAEGQPSQRIVLLKDVSQGGFVFYTNLQSRKALELKGNNRISLHFPWHFLERQVKVCGEAEPLSTMEITKYFLSRPKESQLAAWASEQSRPISTRQMLMTKFEEVKQKFKSGEVPIPSFWGGYRVMPHEIEFWQGGEHRLHDRFVYSKQADSSWEIERLMP
ncbi:pyridoxamine 5'-phosphate oxidase [Paraneptunicella aestuarii]|uniref:pyridoxamine 5'-phosphate oxidase n=1 Tax=Paraneptunicella aestuarii TaxID=2831148 RepID=UPI001E2BF4E7|nr:pyridoxamine 5'-phosphate oxidase [Paraneptunicella aestuarii]UAA40076.1 pyridoxamine 5'-phosphate oxidase [Paraneptunicella aestuarii]